MKMRMNQPHTNQGGAAAYSAQGIRTLHVQAPHIQALSTIGLLFGEAAAMLNLWRSRRGDRRTFRRLDDHMLRDIGLDRFTAEQVGARPFWKA